MSTEPEPTSETGRRKFDDVASLFGTIVPAPGTPVRPTLAPIPAKLPQIDLDATTQRPVPKVLPEAVAPLPAKSGATLTPLRPASAPQPRPAAPPPSPPPVSKLPTADAPMPYPTRGADKPYPLRGANEPGSKKSGSEVPWPDAFTPRPNWRRAAPSRSWSWLLLLPLGAVVAIVFATVDPRVIRDWVDENILHRAPPEASVDNALLPPAFRDTPPSSLPAPATAAVPGASVPGASGPGASGPGTSGPNTPASNPPASIDNAPSTDMPATDGMPSGNAPAASAPSSPEAAAPTATSAVGPGEASSTTTPAVPQPDDHDAVSTRSRPAAPVAPALPAAPSSEGTLPAAGPQPAAPAQSSIASAPPAPASPAPPPAGTAPISGSSVTGIARVVIHYRRSEPGTELEARRIAARLPPEIGDVELRATGTVVRSPIVNYYSSVDRDSAASLARALGDGGGWLVRLASGRQAPGVLEIWLP